MALLVLLNHYLKFSFTVPCLAPDKYAPAFCIRGVLYFLLMPAIWAQHLLFYFFNLNHSPAMEINAFFREFSTSSMFPGEISLALLLLHSFLILCCSLVKCFKTSLSFSARMETILPSGVSGDIPVSRSLNSSHAIVRISFDSRNPYCDWKEAAISP